MYPCGFDTLFTLSDMFSFIYRSSTGRYPPLLQFLWETDDELLQKRFSTYKSDNSRNEDKNKFNKFALVAGAVLASGSLFVNLIKGIGTLNTSFSNDMKCEF